MTKRKPKPRIVSAKPVRILPKGWTLTTYAQWIPVLSVAVGGIIWLTQLQDAVQALKAGASQADIVALRDQINEVAKDESKLEVKEGNDYSEMKSSDQAIWAYVGRSKEAPRP